MNQLVYIHRVDRATDACKNCITNGNIDGAWRCELDLASFQEVHYDSMSETIREYCQSAINEMSDCISKAERAETSVHELQGLQHDTVAEALNAFPISHTVEDIAPEDAGEPNDMYSDFWGDEYRQEIENESR